jgi:glycosyltransferase involved in cell wall biosynthesis
MDQFKKITVLIPCYNEEAGIAEVIERFPVAQLKRAGYLLDILVVDNNSKDQTTAVAKKAGARVIHELKQGKGNAIRTGFYAISDDTDYVVMLDGDNTYRSEEIMRLVEPLENGFSDVIVGSRMVGKMTPGAMKTLNRLGNWIFSFLVRTTYGVNVTDVLTGYFAWKYDAVVRLRPHLQSSGFAIEMEMITKMAQLGLDIYSVPISYEPRLGDSSLRPLQDGIGILMTFFRQLEWQPKLERLAFVSDAIWPFNKGGKEKRLYEITKRLVKPGREITIYTMKWWDGPREIVQDGVRLHAISRLRPLYSGQRRSITQAILFSLTCFKLLWAQFDIVDVDHMPVFPLITMRIVCWLRFKKLYATWHEVWSKAYWLEYMGRKGILGWAMEYTSLQLPDVILSNSLHTTAALRKLGIRKKIATIPLGVDLADIVQAPIHSQHSDVLYVGRLLPHKNVDMLIHAIAKVRLYKKDISCLIVGDGPAFDDLAQLIGELKLKKNITIRHSLKEHSDVFGVMKASRVFVLPSEREGFGVITLEANACGLPVLTLDHPKNAAVALIERGKNGDIFRDVQELAQQLEHYLALPAHPELLPFVEQYDWSKAAELIQQEYGTKAKQGI